MRSKGNGLYSLEEYLVLSNKEIASNPSRINSVIAMFEDIDREEAKLKAVELRKSGTMDEYIDSVRKTVLELEEITPVPQTGTSKSAVFKRPPTVYQNNYSRLMVIAPKLEEKLQNFDGEYIFGKAEKTGYLDFYLEVLRHEGSKFYLAISRHTKNGSGELIPAPDMEILVDIKKKTVESLHYKDAFKDIKVYTVEDGREFTDKKEKRSQNQYLEKWLRELKHQGQKVKWGGKKANDTPSSFIVDNFKKEVPGEVELKIVPPAEEPKKDPKSKDGLEELEQAKIIPLNAGYSEEERRESIESFFRVVTLNEKTGFKEIAIKALKIINDGKTVPYLITAWKKMKESDFNHVIRLNYFRLNAIVPNLLEVLKQEGGTIRLVSEQTKTAYRITLGDDRKENVVILGIYQMNGKNPEPTLLVKVNTDSGTISTELSTNRFAGLKDFNADEPSRYFELLYESAIGFERWLKYLELKVFNPLLVTLKKVEEEPIITFHEPEHTEEPVNEEPEEKHSKYYINNGIPDFPPGKGELVEAHKKYGVTQEMIDWINKHDKPLVVIPRKKAMIYNTKDKEADLKKQALQPGLRLSRNFKFYPESRTNRADRTLNGY